MRLNFAIFFRWVIYSCETYDGWRFAISSICECINRGIVTVATNEAEGDVSSVDFSLGGKRIQNIQLFGFFAVDELIVRRQKRPGQTEMEIISQMDASEKTWRPHEEREKKKNCLS